MLKKTLSLLLIAAALMTPLAGCAASDTTEITPATTVAATAAPTEAATETPTEAATETTAAPETTENILPDGVYTAKFDTDSSMFSVNETKEGRGILTVADGQMIIHVSLRSVKIVNLFPGTAEEAQTEGAVLLEHTEDTVTYPDGTSETVFGFDIPVPYLDAEFDCALIGTKGTWYNHKVSVSDAVPMEDAVEGQVIAVTLSGGSGKAKVESPAKLIVQEDGTYTAIIVWGSPNYEYMIVNDVQYDPIQAEGNSTFEIPIELDTDMAVSALTVAMSNPHLVDYTLHFDSSTIK